MKYNELEMSISDVKVVIKFMKFSRSSSVGLLREGVRCTSCRSITSPPTNLKFYLKRTKTKQNKEITFVFVLKNEDICDNNSSLDFYATGGRSHRRDR